MTAGRAPRSRRPALVALARLANTLFFLVTSLYCLLTYSSFAYQQFIRPHLINWLSGFVVWHHLGFWLVLAVTAWTLVPDLGRGSRGRAIGWGYLGASTLIGMLLLVRPVLPQVENDGRGLALALAALAPPIWLAIFDHRRTAAEAPPLPSSERRVVRAVLLAGAVVWLGQVVAIPWRLDQTGEIRLSTQAIAYGVLTSAAAHLLVFSLLAFAAAACLRAGRLSTSRGRAEYWLIAGAAGSTVALIIDRQVFAAIAFTGRAAWAMAMAIAAMLTLVWSAAARARAGGSATAMEVWLSPVPGLASRRWSMAVLGSLALIEIGLLAYVTPFDWDFVLLKLCVMAVWFAAAAYAFGALSGSGGRVGWASLGTPALAGALLFGGGGVTQARIPDWVGDAEFIPDFVLEGYVAVDPSYRVIHDALRVESREDAGFFGFLRAHSLIQHVTVDPVDVSFVAPHALARKDAADRPRPNIFLFVIDSLRRDYLSPYNPAVRFTPAIGAFAADSVVFERAFTRYGGTGLAVPALWAGGMLLHKQYVTPFGPMNALLKLIEADGYRRLMSMDSIVVQLIPPPPPEDELDRGVHIMSYRFCRTLDDLTGKLRKGIETASRTGRRQPVFAYSLPQDLHISHIRGRPVPPGASYPGFFPPVAAQVEEMDACFGRFVAFLESSGLYEESVIVITSDHGDSLGEGLRWGHSYTMFPEVSRIPMIVRVPERYRAGLAADPRLVSFSTDLTPTFYALAGHAPRDLGPLYGRPLLVRRDADLEPRRREPQLIASSYGGVYAVLRDNGTRLYIADGVNKREYAYDLGAGAARRVGIPAAERAANRRFIREQVDAVARQYRFSPQP